MALITLQLYYTVAGSDRKDVARIHVTKSNLLFSKCPTTVAKDKHTCIGRLSIKKSLD